MIDDDELPSLPLPLMSPPNLLPLFFCVWSRYPVASPFFVFLFWLSIFLFFSLLVSQHAKCIYSFLVLYISLFFLSSLSSRIFNFLCTIFLFTFIHTNITPTYTLSHPTPLPAQMHTCAYSPFCACIITNPHTYTICLLSAHPHFLIFFLPLHTKKQFTTLSTLLYNLIKQISLS